MSRIVTGLAALLGNRAGDRGQGVRKSCGLDEIMSLTYATTEGTNLVTVAFAGDLEADQVDALRRHIEGVVAERGSVRLLLEYGSAGKVEPKAIYEDLRNAEFVKKIDRAAIVSDASWLGGLTSIAKHFVPFDVKTFRPDEHGAALEWVTD